MPFPASAVGVIRELSVLLLKEPPVSLNDLPADHDLRVLVQIQEAILVRSDLLTRIQHTDVNIYIARHYTERQ